MARHECVYPAVILRLAVCAQHPISVREKAASVQLSALKAQLERVCLAANLKLAVCESCPTSVRERVASAQLDALKVPRGWACQAVILKPVVCKVLYKTFAWRMAVDALRAAALQGVSPPIWPAITAAAAVCVWNAAYLQVKQAR